MTVRTYFNKTRILERDGRICGYCFERVATQVDHIIPVSYRLNNSDDNLMACCSDCNSIAGNLIFESVEEKRIFIQTQLKRAKWQRRRLLTQNESLVFPEEAQEDPAPPPPVVTTKPKEQKERVKVDFQATITGVELEALRHAFKESLSEFGARLKKVIDPKAMLPYTRQYISRLEHGKDVITKEIEYAYWEIKRGFDKLPAGIAGSVYVMVKARPGQIEDGVFLPRKGEASKCANPSCDVIFVKVHPRQKYHDPECR